MLRTLKPRAGRCPSRPVRAPPPQPLRILFCGSDDFSIASLRALVEAKRDAPDLIQSIDVLHRPAKPAGRGRRTLREVPIKQVATEELNLPTHPVDTFNGWTPPALINLIITASFGLFIPPHILECAKYRGLNVHPSLLPDLRGAAPIQHAIGKGRKYTGITIQTLHAKEFDRGTIVAQTPAPGIEIPHDIKVSELEQQLAKTGAEMLVDVLKSHKHVPPFKDAGWYAKYKDDPVASAPKVSKQDRFIDFRHHTMAEILTIQRAFGDPWCLLPTAERLILHDIVDLGHGHVSSSEPGLFYDEVAKEPRFRTACGSLGILKSSTYEGWKQGQGNAKLTTRVLSPLARVPQAASV
ncbi:Formyltransferase [Decorospora gaudefroyi]|uniref:methionyl-tRNA formyltransferase n=1 Tax=Decorospora gaudefroyi TaxID=184978 RepID=A0A6A5KHP8_9PLEO|nr:Formyltransferase [Decorospora gaudefroyi]